MMSLAPGEIVRGDMMTITGRTGRDYKALYRKLEAMLDRIERVADTSVMLTDIVESLIGGFREELGFEGGRLYTRRGEDFVLVSGHGTCRDLPPGLLVPRNYPPHCRTLEQGLLIMRASEEGFDPQFERTIGVHGTFAAIAVGEGKTHVIAFSVRGEVMEEQILYSLAAVRHGVNIRLQHEHLKGMLEESRLIQESLLPAGPPEFEGYEIAGLSRPTEIVGGDLLDYIPLTPRMLGIAIGDASGHGLPAALLARDVVTGLRMGVSAETKIVRVIERLNRVIHQAALSSKFISLFYAELETNGTLTYCNAGHDPPLLFRRKSTITLRRGGQILGPDPAAGYERGHARMVSGDVLVLYTDGLIDWADPEGRPFGVGRLRRLIPRCSQISVENIVETIFDAAGAHAGGTTSKDDITVMAIRRL